MHSLHYESFTIHFNGDYSGEHSISNISTNESGISTYNEIEISSRKFDAIAKKIIKTKSYQQNITLKGITLNSNDIVDFYLQKLRSQEISKLESMTFNQLLKRYGNKN